MRCKDKDLEGLTIEPYVETQNSEMTFSDEEITNYYDLIVGEGVSHLAFYNKTNYSSQDFLRDMKDKSCALWILKIKGKLAGGFLLDGFQGKAAFSHFYSARFTWGGLNVKIFREAAKMLLTYESEPGVYALDVLIGLTPVSQQKVHDFIDNVGCKYLCIIPNMTYNAAKKCSEPGRLSYFDRECFK